MENISPEESLSRYIFSEKLYAKSPGRVKHAAFMPRENEAKISIYRTSGLEEAKIWDIGKEIAVGRSHSVKGRAELMASCVLEKNLKVEPEEPPEHHANIIFPSSEKSEQKLIAIQLAEEAQLRLLPVF